MMGSLFPNIPERTPPTKIRSRNAIALLADYQKVFSLLKRMKKADHSSPPASLANRTVTSFRFREIFFHQNQWAHTNSFGPAPNSSLHHMIYWMITQSFLLQNLPICPQ